VKILKNKAAVVDTFTEFPFSICLLPSVSKCLMNDSGTDMTQFSRDVMIEQRKIESNE
jgi:hypothetical protein